MYLYCTTLLIVASKQNSNHVLPDIGLASGACLFLYIEAAYQIMCGSGSNRQSEELPFVIEYIQNIYAIVNNTYRETNSLAFPDFDFLNAYPFYKIEAEDTFLHKHYEGAYRSLAQT